VIREHLVKADPGNAGWQCDLSVSHNEIGDVQQVQGDLAAALTSYRASLAIASNSHFDICGLAVGLSERRVSGKMALTAGLAAV
jgi:hypothetical protein